MLTDLGVLLAAPLLAPTLHTDDFVPPLFFSLSRLRSRPPSLLLRGVTSDFMEKFEASRVSSVSCYPRLYLSAFLLSGRKNRGKNRAFSARKPAALPLHLAPAPSLVPIPSSLLGAYSHFLTNRRLSWKGEELAL